VKGGAPVLLALAASFALAACGGDAKPRIRVAAAADLRFAFDELARAYEATCRCQIDFSFGSSGTLATQIAEGLDVDIFASADAAYVDDLEKKARILAGSRQVYALGRIVIAAPAGSSLRLEKLDDLVSAAVGKIAIANPEHAPYGRAAKQALVALRLWEDVEGRLVLGENASIATQYVETRNADAGIVPLSLAIQRQAQLRYVLIDDRLHQPLIQVAAVIAGSNQKELASGFVSFINSDQGRPIMRKYGFVLPGELAAR
jgi:molybdate transport system substrate-binding protein